MSTRRNIDRICIVVLVLTLLLTVVFMNGERLGIRVTADEDAESYSSGSYFTENDLDGDWADNSYTTYITLDGSGGEINGNGAYFLNGDLVISNGGWYVLSGTLEDGSIIVDADDSSKIWIRLSGVSINCSDDACLQVDQADKVFLTLAKDTENVFTSGSTYSEDALSDNTGGAIFSHDDLTINGSGSLAITAGYKHGIDVNDSLVITGGSITISAPQDGIHVNDSFRYAEASLIIDAGDDAVHSDDELYIESGTILIHSCYEGLEAITVDIAGGNITIYPRDDGINANGDDNAMEFGGMEVPPSGSTGNRDRSEAGGMPAPPELPDGEMSSVFTEISGRQEEAQTETDDSSDEKEAYIRISGGTLTIINETGRDADGLDSNGNIYIGGGDIRISLPGDGNNCAIDYGSESGGECIVTGGTVLAFGGSSMTEDFSSDSSQCAVLYNLDSTMEADTLFQVLSEDGDEILSFAPACGYSSIAFSAPELTVGETYTIVCGENSTELTLDSTATSTGSSGSTPSQDMGQTGFMPESKESGSEMHRGGPTRPDENKEDANGFVSEEPVNSEDKEIASGNFISLNEIDKNVWILSGASVLVLAAAILIARKYHRN
ncbi:carbohydrate-binding domain-containing protein [Lachnoclostridium sp. Marseille-P6806]|uniref:carbohydrate-binding domain-containing protein n=1 Tax=Lachnoclostridium sp. Marseille-P6806 TaxID=2364793 RepID=UPI0010323E5F|nr:carbohydrate-binding domain-containing protein [Lachnoclostridium sp. Marseille-P6806]